jgi:hypothetical protein
MRENVRQNTFDNAGADKGTAIHTGGKCEVSVIGGASINWRNERPCT